MRLPTVARALITSQEMTRSGMELKLEPGAGDGAALEWCLISTDARKYRCRLRGALLWQLRSHFCGHVMWLLNGSVNVVGCFGVSHLIRFQHFFILFSLFFDVWPGPKGRE